MQSFDSFNHLKLPPPVDWRLQELVKRSSQGLLNEDERKELAVLLEVNRLLSLVRAKAQELQKSPPQTPCNLGHGVRNGLPFMVVPPGTPNIDVEKVRRFLQEEGF